jgi:hypothetical protein
VIEAATTIHVTASGGPPIHVALLSIDGRRVFAKFDAPAESADELAVTLPGRRARFVITQDGDHRVELLSGAAPASVCGEKSRARS